MFVYLSPIYTYPIFAESQADCCHRHQCHLFAPRQVKFVMEYDERKVLPPQELHPKGYPRAAAMYSKHFWGPYGWSRPCIYQYIPAFGRFSSQRGTPIVIQLSIYSTKLQL